ncbi:MAG: UMP kinase [Methanoregulaceae archaeon]
MKTIVLSLGGSILFPSLEKNTLKSYVPVLRSLAGKRRVFVVVGGGGEARRYIDAAREHSVDDGTCDEIGILVTRLNATMLCAALGDAAYPRVPVNQTEAMEAALSGKIVVMGGITPGQTTDAVAAVLAERVHADAMINLTSVDGIYDKDPNKFPDAKRYAHLTPEELIATVGKGDLKAGSNNVIDLVAAKVTARSGVPLLVFDGRDAANLTKALVTGEFSGTVVSAKKKNVLPI